MIIYLKNFRVKFPIPFSKIKFRFNEKLEKCLFKKKKSKEKQIFKEKFEQNNHKKKGLNFLQKNKSFKKKILKTNKFCF